MNTDNQKKKTQLPTSVMLFLRIFIGCYLCYLAYQILNSSDTSLNQALLYVIVAVFIIAGVGIIILSLKMIIRGEYQGGFGDIDSDEDSAEENIEKSVETIEEKTADDVDNDTL